MKNVTGIITANYKTDGLRTLASERGVASLPYGGRYRLVDFPLSSMVNSGITSIGLITPPKFRSIIDHVGTGSNWTLDRKRGGLFILPGSSYGTANQGARFMIRDLIENKTFFTRSHSEYFLFASSSIVYNIDFNELVDSHLASGADITVMCKKAVRENETLMHFTEEKGKVTGASMGAKVGDLSFLDVFVINRDFLLRTLEWNESDDYLDLFDVFIRDIKNINMEIWMYEGYSRGIFSVKSYLEASMDLLNMDVNEEIFDEERPIRTKVQDSVPAKIYGNAKVHNSLVSAGCEVYGTVENSILFRGVVVEEGAVVKDSIVMQSSVVKKGAKIQYGIIDRNNMIVENVEIKGAKDDPFVLLKESRPVKKH